MELKKFFDRYAIFYTIVAISIVITMTFMILRTTKIYWFITEILLVTFSVFFSGFYIGKNAGMLGKKEKTISESSGTLTITKRIFDVESAMQTFLIVGFVILAIVIVILELTIDI